MSEGLEKDISGKAVDTGLLLKVYNLIKPYRHLFYISVGITFLNSIVGPAIPYAIRHTIDEEILKIDSNGLRLWTGIILGLLLAQGALTYLQTYLTNYLGQNAIKHLRDKVFNHILNFKSKVFDNTPIGTFITRTVTDVERVADIFSQGLINILGDLLQLIIILTIMFYTDWELTLVMLTVFPFLIAISYVFKEKVKVAFQDVRTQVSRLNAFLQEHITGMGIVKIFNKEDEEMEKFDQINQQHRDANIRSVFYYALFFPAIELFSAAAIALIVWYGTQSVLSGQVTFGTLVLFILYINMMFRPVRAIANNFNVLQMGMVASSRIFRVLEHEESIANNGLIKPEQVRGDIRFNNVWFAYEDEEYVLKDLSFDIKEGQNIAIVGSTGAGKTTITNLLTRMYDINHGSITLDGRDIRDYELEHLRSQISIVLQDVFLFSDTIANNIRLYESGVTEAQMEQAARRIGADRFIKELPNGFDTEVQERGASLSAGQRQLISFIRAIIQNPQILILDEATSSVDNETEELIQEATEALLKGRTSIVIAHRLATIKNADQILVMEKGEIKERGTHSELMAQEDGLYKQLIRLQFTELAV
jgi:ATP-binding cassette subfamily B protein